MKQVKKNEFTTLMDIEGVDAYAILDSEFRVIESRGPLPISSQQNLFAKILSLSFRDKSPDIQTSIILAEQGAWVLAKIPGRAEAAYLVLLAATETSVDIPELESRISDLLDSLQKS